VGYVRFMFDPYSSSRQVTSDGVSLCVTDHGPTDGVPVLLLHGFPDSARLWRRQIPALADAGYRVLAPDMRGFGRSDRPEAVEAYAIHSLVADVAAVMEGAGCETAHVVGHDWGAAVAWAVAMALPTRVRTLTAVSVGHPAAFAAAGIPQREKSWYMLLFQFEGVAEAWLSGGDWKWMKEWSGEPVDTDLWIEDLSRPGALRAALNVYRANTNPARMAASLQRPPQVACDVMGVWSDGDRFLLESQMVGSGAFVDGEWRYERIDGASHWLPVDAPDEFNALLLDWFGSHG